MVQGGKRKEKKGKPTVSVHQLGIQLPELPQLLLVGPKHLVSEDWMMISESALPN